MPIILSLLSQYGPTIATFAFATFGGWLMKQHSRNKLLQAALDMANGAVGTAVRSVAQTYVDALASAAKDGLITEAEKSQALRLAIQATLVLIPPNILEILHSVYPGAQFDAFLVHTIEAAVKDLSLKRAADFAEVPGLTRVRQS